MNIEKKQWIAPQASEIEVNGGVVGGIYENVTNSGQAGTIS